MKFYVAIVSLMTLAGVVFPFRPAELSFAAEYQYWMWHERTTGCTMFTQVKNGADMINVTRPIGLTKQKCIELLGPPTNEFHRDSSQGPWRELEFQKSDQYDISLFFNADDICTEVGLAYAGSGRGCLHFSSMRAHTFLDRYCLDDFAETCHRQPGYRPPVEYPRLSRAQRDELTRKMCKNTFENRGWLP